MWQIKIVYKDFSENIFKGIEADIDYTTAIDYYNNYVSNHNVFTATYQQYPINKHKRLDLIDKIEQLRQVKLASHRLLMDPNKLGPGRVVKYEFDVFVSESDSPIFNLEIISKAMENSGFIVLNSSYDSDVTYDYVKVHPELVWKKVLETEDAIYYLQNSASDNRVKKYSKIGCREYEGYHTSLELIEVIKSYDNGIIQPVYIDKEEIKNFYEKES